MSDSSTPQLGLFDSALWSHAACRQGIVDMLPLSIGFGAWGLVTGVAMVQGGLPVPIALLMGLTVFAAGAQLAALPLLVLGAPMWVVWLTALCVNLRFVIFSADTRRHMVCLAPKHRLLAGYMCADLPYVLLSQKYRDKASASSKNIEPLAYFCGLVAVNWSIWNITVVIGIVCASFIPPEWGVGFAGTLALLALLMSLIINRLFGIAALAAALVGVMFYTLPFKLFILLAVVAGVATGLFCERLLTRRAPD